MDTMSSSMGALAKALDYYYQNQNKIQRAPILNPKKARAEYRKQYELKKNVLAGMNYQTNLTYSNNAIFASTNPFSSLQRAGIQDLILHEPAKGQYLLLRTIEPPILTVGIMVFVEDHLGRIIIATFYNFINYEMTIPVEEILPVGTILILKEPFLKLAASGQIVIRCDCPSDVIRVDCSHSMYESASKIQWKNSPNWQYFTKTPSRNALDWKTEGNSLYGKKRYQHALEAYLVSLKMSTDPDFITLLRLNISAASLNFEMFEQALKYAKLVLESNPEDVKALCRAGKSLYNLRLFKESLGMFERLVKIEPLNQYASTERKNCEERLKECEGSFDIYKLYLTSLVKPGTLIDFGEYVGPIEIAQIEGKGRGIIASKNIQPGTYLLASKAFQTTFETSLVNTVAALSLDFHSWTMDHGNKVKLLAQTCQLVMKNPNTFGKPVYSLSTNDPELDKSFKLFCDETKKTEPIADTNRLNKILNHNCFSLLPTKDQEQCFTCEKFTGSGFFILASYFNHACVSNATWNTYNDVIVIRSIKFISKGDEITIPYTSGREDFQTKEKKDAQRGFHCMCVLCRLDRSEPMIIHDQRSLLHKQHEELSAENFSDMIINPSNVVKEQMNQITHRLEMSYGERSNLKIRLFEPYIRVAQGIPVKPGDEYATKLTEVVDVALRTLGLSCEMLLKCASDKEYCLPQDTLLCHYSIRQALVLLIFRFHFIDCLPLVKKWAKVLVKIEQLFTGGNIQMIKSQYKDKLPFLYGILSNLLE